MNSQGYKLLDRMHPWFYLRDFLWMLSHNKPITISTPAAWHCADSSVLCPLLLVLTNIFLNPRVRFSYLHWYTSTISTQEWIPRMQLVPMYMSLQYTMPSTHNFAFYKAGKRKKRESHTCLCASEFLASISWLFFAERFVFQICSNSKVISVKKGIPEA